MQLDPKALWTVSYGMYLVTGSSGQRANGQIANTVFQVTAEPPRVAVALNHENLTHALVCAGRWFGLSVLTDETPMDFIGLWGFRSGREVDKLANATVRAGRHVPLVADHALAVLEAEVIQQIELGSHTLFVGQVTGGEVLGNGTPLTYAAYHARKGRAPRTAPTFRGEAETQAAPAPAAAATFECDVCGYTYDPRLGDAAAGIPSGTRFEDLPDTWTCPVCGAPRSSFRAQ